jgi:hypothetical protein
MYLYIYLFHLIYSHAWGCAVDEEEAEAEGAAGATQRRDGWALVIPKGIGSLSSVNVSEIDLLDRVRMAIQIAQGVWMNVVSLCFTFLFCSFFRSCYDSCLLSSNFIIIYFSLPRCVRC